MNQKDNLIERLKLVFERWENFFTSRTNEQLVAPSLPGGWSIRDVILHLMAWQQISIAHMQAVREGGDPRLPGWLGGADPFYAEDHTTEFNARILEIHSMDSWVSAHKAWQDGFLRLIGLAEGVPEHEMFDAKKYQWLGGYPPSAVIAGSCEHHEEHLQEALATIK